MTFQPGAQVYTAGFGLRPENVEVPHYDTRVPNTTDVLYPLGKRWIYTGNSEWVLLSFTSSAGTITANWVLVTSAGGTLDTLTGDSGGAILPSITGNITLAGTANQITSIGSGNTITFSLIGPYTPATYTAHSVLLGEGTSSIGTAGPNAASGIPLISQGAAADPIFGTALVPGGGTGAVTFTAHGVILGEGTSALGVTAVGSTGQVLTGVTGADPTWVNLPAFNVVDNTTGTVASPTAMTVNTKYVADQASVTTGFILPASATLGQTITVLGNGPGGWQIQQNAGQSIKENGNTTTTGTSGTLSSTNRYNCVTLQCIVAGASTVWNVGEFSGTFTFV